MNNLIRVLPSLCLAIWLLTAQALLKAQPPILSPALSSITIAECYEWTRTNYPLVQQLNLIDKTTEFSLSNASKGNMPQININGQATYQSEVTEVPINLPNIEIPTLSKAQYKVYGEIYQPLTNFRNINSKKELVKANGEIEKQRLEVDLYQLKERVNNIYFGLLLIDAKNQQIGIIKNDLDSALVKVNAAVQNGTATLIDQQLLQVEIISLLQQTEENKANKMAFLKMLSTLTGKNIGMETQLIQPEPVDATTKLNRPELKLFRLQRQILTIQDQQVKNKLMPNLGLFLQGGLGRPTLNFLSNEFSLYYIGGLKFNWNLSSLYSRKNDKQALNITSGKIANQEASFLLNTQLIQSQQLSEIEKYHNLIESDQEIIKIRETVKETAQVQLSNGLITTIDFIRFLNEENKARQVLSLHETQLLLAQHNLKTTSGN